MCTLTIYRSKNNDIFYGAMMNRDERYEREEGHFYQSNGQYYPTDKLTNGTWAGTNRSGLMLFLLNRYELQQSDGPPALISRGSIIPKLLAQANTVEEALRCLPDLPLQQMAPFTLILQDQTTLWRWDWTGISRSSVSASFSNSVIDDSGIESHCLFRSGKGAFPSDAWPVSWQLSTSSLFLNSHPTEQSATTEVAMWLFSSSSVETQRILSYRKKLFSKFWLQKTFNLNRLCLFHQHQPDGFESESVCMSRKKTHTKSWVFYQYNNKNRGGEGLLEFSYLPIKKHLVERSYSLIKLKDSFTFSWLNDSGCIGSEMNRHLFWLDKKISY